MQEDKGNQPTTVSWGGPVSQEKIHGIHDGQGLDAISLKLHDGIYFGGRWESFMKWHEKNHTMRFFLGHSGWEIEQLAEEINAGGWHIHTGSINSSLRNNCTHLWHRLTGEIDPNLSWLRDLPDNPSNN